MSVENCGSKRKPKNCDHVPEIRRGMGAQLQVSENKRHVQLEEPGCMSEEKS